MNRWMSFLSGVRAGPHGLSSIVLERYASRRSSSSHCVREADVPADYDDVKRLNSFTTFGIFDAAVIAKDGDGGVRVNKDEKTTRQGALAGAVVGILFPPLLVADVALGALAGHLWGGMSRADMKDLGELLDEGEVALVVVAEVDREG